MAIVLGNGVDFLLSFLAIVRAGAMAAPLNPAGTEYEFDAMLRQLRCGRVVTSDKDGAAVTAAARRLNLPVLAAADVGGRTLCAACPQDIAVVLQTSGTTSIPKVVPLTHANIAASARNVAATYRLSPADVALVAMPLFHVHGLIGVALSTLASGGTLVVPPRFSARQFWSLQSETGATWYSAVPTIHHVLVERASDEMPPSHGFRFIRSCSAALTPALQARLEMLFDVPVLQAYGMTETAHQIASNHLFPADRVPGTVGYATGVDIAIDKGQGEVLVRGETVTPGYLDNPAANDAAFTGGWLRTGDLGTLDSCHRLTLIGRIKELINRGGEKISPVEIDTVILEHPDVDEVVSFGVPDRKYGEVVEAAVVLRRDIPVTTLLTHCRNRLADHKVPARIHITDRIARSATGKVHRRAVAAAFSHSS